MTPAAAEGEPDGAVPPLPALDADACERLIHVGFKNGDMRLVVAALTRLAVLDPRRAGPIYDRILLGLRVRKTLTAEQAVEAWKAAKATADSLAALPDGFEVQVGVSVPARRYELEQAVIAAARELCRTGFGVPDEALDDQEVALLSAIEGLDEVLSAEERQG